MFDSPIVYIAGGVILIGGAWYAISKWAGASKSKCLDKATLATVVESILHGDKTSAEARTLATALEKDGCAAEDVKSIRDAADARDKAAPAPKSEPAPEVKKDTSAIDIDTGPAKIGLPKPPKVGKVAGWPSVQALPEPYRSEVLRAVAAINYDNVVKASDNGYAEIGSAFVCRGPCGAAEVNIAADYVGGLSTTWAKSEADLNIVSAATKELRFVSFVLTKLGKLAAPPAGDIFPTDATELVGAVTGYESSRTKHLPPHLRKKVA